MTGNRDDSPKAVAGRGITDRSTPGAASATYELGADFSPAGPASMQAREEAMNAAARQKATGRVNGGQEPAPIRPKDQA